MYRVSTWYIKQNQPIIFSIHVQNCFVLRVSIIDIDKAHASRLEQMMHRRALVVIINIDMPCESEYIARYGNFVVNILG